MNPQTGIEGNGSGWCRLDERWLAALGHGRLRHYVADGGLLLSLLEEPLANSQEPQPTLIGAYWAMRRELGATLPQGPFLFWCGTKCKKENYK